jgi:tetratricopeptide (TPR) repeat protein
MSEFESTFALARSFLLQRRYEEAERGYLAAVVLEPASLDAQYMLAKVRYMRGDPRFARDLAAATARNRGDAPLQLLFANVLRHTGDLAGSELLLRDLIARHGPDPQWRSALASVLQEMNRLDEALSEAQLAVQTDPENAHLREVLVSVLLSLGRASDAMRHIREMRRIAPGEQIWIAHEATAARLIEDRAYPDLYDYERFVRVYDLDVPAGWNSLAEFNAELEARLSERHGLVHQPFDQSMRSGTQTMGSLADDDDPVIQEALGAFMAPIEDYRAALGTDAGHPLSYANRGTARIATCWSVRLRAQGFHVNHIHPAGWLSSAYYVAVPPETNDENRQSGWIQFGAPRDPVPGAGPALKIRPRVGRLVLFPSYMWHGTTAIQEATPRMTMAFDVVTQR